MSYIFQDDQLARLEDQQNSQLRIWSRGKYNLIETCLAEIDWYDEFFTLDCHSQYDKLLNILNSLIDHYVPLSTKKIDRLPWKTNPPRALLRSKKEAWREYKLLRGDLGRNSHFTDSAWCRFQNCNNSIKHFAVNSQKSYEKLVASQLKTNPKLFHSYIKHRRVGRPSIGPLSLEDGSITDNPQQMANCFAESFSSVFSNYTAGRPTLSP